MERHPGGQPLEPAAGRGALLSTLARERTAAEVSLPAVPECAALPARLKLLRQARHQFAARTDALVAAISPELARTHADTLAAEVLPLLAACRFLEREATAILAPRRLGRRGLPFWLAGVHSTVERVAMGRVLVIGPANYPLFLPGVQVLQALAAGNSVVWKPGRGGLKVALIFAEAMQAAGLPESSLRVTGESVAAAEQEISRGADKIFFTGSAAAGKAVLRKAAETATPVVAELSGCDAVYVLPGADQDRVVAALAFGMRLNGSATCMAPRRLMLIGASHAGLIDRLKTKFADMDAIALAPPVARQLTTLVAEAASDGATVYGEPEAAQVRPILVTGGRPEMRLAQADLFAPVLTTVDFATAQDALEADRRHGFGLTAAVFGPEPEALHFGSQLTVGTLLINDLIVPTADPRVPFGGRRGSGFGSTRGAEGLLEMTAPRTVLVRRGGGIRHYGATGEAHAGMFSGVAAMQHAAGWQARLTGFRQMIAAARRLK